MKKLFGLIALILVVLMLTPTSASAQISANFCLENQYQMRVGSDWYAYATLYGFDESGYRTYINQVALNEWGCGQISTDWNGKEIVSGKYSIEFSAYAHHTKRVEEFRLDNGWTGLGTVQIALSPYVLQPVLQPSGQYVDPISANGGRMSVETKIISHPAWFGKTTQPVASLQVSVAGRTASWINYEDYKEVLWLSEYTTHKFFYVDVPADVPNGTSVCLTVVIHDKGDPRTQHASMCVCGTKGVSPNR